MAKRTPLKAIRAKCLDCVCGQIMEINKCHIKECPLWEYRRGKRPKGDDLLTEDELDGELEGYVPTDEQEEGDIDGRL